MEEGNAMAKEEMNMMSVEETMNNKRYSPVSGDTMKDDIKIKEQFSLFALENGCNTPYSVNRVNENYK